MSTETRNPGALRPHPHTCEQKCDTTSATKRCGRCGGHQPLDEFYRNKSTKDGLACYCKRCVGADQKQRYDSRRDMPERTADCAHCKQPFTYYAPKHQTRRFCSRRCLGLSQQVAPLVHTCRACGAEFLVKPYALRQDYKGWFCSRRCSHPHIAQKQRGQPRDMAAAARGAATRRAQHAAGLRPPRRLHGPPLPPKPCLQCAALFRRGRTELFERWEQRRFCSAGCWYEHQRTHPGTNPNWRGGYAPYYGPNWPKQRAKARERDQYSCQDCGKAQHRPALDVHHLVARQEFGADYVAANALANLITLCKSCHSTRGSGRPRVSTERAA